MINILIVDDEELISQILKRQVQRYFKQNNIESYTVDIAPDGLKAVELMDITKYALVFLDVIMPKMDGFDVLDSVRITKKDQHQPYICMVTGMGEDEDKRLFREKKATSYVIKPFDTQTIHMMLDKFIKPLIETEIQEEEVVDDFDDFDDFMDFYDEDEDFDLDEEEMDLNNKSHAKVTATDFIKEYDDISYMLEDLSDIDELLVDIIEYLDIQSINKYKEDITLVLRNYSSFLSSLSDFDHLASSIENTNHSISNIDFNSLDEKKATYIIEFIRAILKDLSSWKEHVFIAQDAVDVFYINASALSSCAQLNNLIK